MKGVFGKTPWGEGVLWKEDSLKCGAFSADTIQLILEKASTNACIEKKKDSLQVALKSQTGTVK